MNQRKCPSTRNFTPAQRRAALRDYIAYLEPAAKTSEYEARMLVEAKAELESLKEAK